jgi:hypothetical protein
VIKQLGMPGECTKQLDAIKKLHDDVGDAAEKWEKGITPIPKEISKE